jgi:hypothetical protein
VKRTSSGIFLPGHHRLHNERPKYVCVVCVERGEPGEFYDPITYERHVSGTATSPACADRHPETIRRMSPALRAPGLFDENYPGSDLEWKRWLEKNADLIAEGRKNDRTYDGKRGGGLGDG